MFSLEGTFGSGRDGDLLGNFSGGGAFLTGVRLLAVEAVDRTDVEEGVFFTVSKGPDLSSCAAGVDTFFAFDVATDDATLEASDSRRRRGDGDGSGGGAEGLGDNALRVDTVDCVEVVESLRDRATDSRAVLKVVDAVEASLLAERDADEVGLEAGEGCFGRRESPTLLFRAVDVDALDRTDETDGAFDFGRAKPAAETGGTRGPTPVRFDDAIDAVSRSKPTSGVACSDSEDGSTSVAEE